MINQLYKWFIKDYEEVSKQVVRERYGKLAGAVGVVSNIFLFIIKVLAGVLFNSIAITADAVNNLSDAGSSVITLIGFKISGKPADEKHPYGHARVEYISGFIVSVIIVLLGIELVKTSFEKIIHPEPINFSYLSVVVLVIAILTKFWQSLFNRTTGRRIHSTALLATGMDSMNDVIATASVLAATVFAKITGIQIDGHMGVIVALFIIYSGFKLIGETMDPLLGLAPDAELVHELEKKILSYEGVLGLHDLVVHSYGPDKSYASVHVEVPARGDLLESHDLIDTIEREVSYECDIHLVIHMDPTITDDEEINDLRHQTGEIVQNIDPKLTIHDFRVVKGKNNTNLVFDVVVPPAYKISDTELRESIQEGVSNMDPSFHSVITLDRSYTSTTND
ncbi:MAG TPA: cation-efflux pump [Ruminiclostridium sp.]|nr:cation-efflux pump [Ruminiclostridium sp.]